jgi:hypothetical protein
VTAPQIHDPAYQRYLSEAHAELDEMLGDGTPDPVPAPPGRDDRWAKVVVAVLIAAAVLVIGILIGRGIGRSRRMAFSPVRR